MVARSGDRQGAFGHLLASDIDEIQIVLGVAVVDLFESAWDRIDFQGAGHDKNLGAVPGFLMSILARKCFASAGTVPGFLPSSIRQKNVGTDPEILSFDSILLRPLQLLTQLSVRPRSSLWS